MDAPPDPEAALAERLYPKDRPLPENPTVPGHVRRFRESDPARRMFSPQHLLKGDIPDDLFGDGGAEAVAEMRELAADLDLGGADLRGVVAVLKKALAESPTEEQQQAWKAESEKRLGEIYGQRADGVLGLAQRLVHRDPRVGKLIDGLGVGNNPEVTRVFAEAALRAATRGRL